MLVISAFVEETSRAVAATKHTDANNFQIRKVMVDEREIKVTIYDKIFFIYIESLSQYL